MITIEPNSKRDLRWITLILSSQGFKFNLIAYWKVEVPEQEGVTIALIESLFYQHGVLFKISEA